jgi:multicomponent K+:H+ antiporter subunit E
MDRIVSGKSRGLTRPFTSLAIAASWLLLQQSAALPQLIVAVVLAVLLPRLLAGFLGPPVKIAPWSAMMRLAGIVLWDIVASNIRVAKIVLDPARQPQPAWALVPLDIRHPNGIALLASIITMTPGTVSCVIDEARYEILVHALDCDDPDAMARDIKLRYEQTLMEIFE